jgi:hypothetical protein
MRQGLDGP